MIGNPQHPVRQAIATGLVSAGIRPHDPAYYKAIDAIEAELSRAAAPEPEWEYGTSHIHPEKPVTIVGTLGKAIEARAFYGHMNQKRGHGGPSRIFRRTKAVPAGPWLPVGVDDAE